MVIFFVLANENKIDLCRLKSPLSKDETRRDGSIPFIVILSLNHYSFCETMSQVLLSWTPLTEFDNRLNILVSFFKESAYLLFSVQMSSAYRE